MVYNLSLVCTTLLEIFLLQNLVISLAKSACRLEAALPHLCTIGQLGPASSLTQQTTIRQRLCARHHTTRCDHNMESVMAMRKTTDKPQGRYLTTAVTDTIEGKWADSELAFPDHIYLSRGKHAVWPWGKRKGHSRASRAWPQKGKCRTMAQGRRQSDELLHPKVAAWQGQRKLEGWGEDGWGVWTVPCLSALQL